MFKVPKQSQVCSQYYTCDQSRSESIASLYRAILCKAIGYNCTE